MTYVLCVPNAFSMGLAQTRVRHEISYHWGKIKILSTRLCNYCDKAVASLRAKREMRRKRRA